MKKLILLSLTSLMISGCSVPENPTNKPADLSYTPDSVVFEYGEPVSLSPSNKGGKIDRYTINTSLPNNLLFDEQTGKISGEAVIPIDSQAFIITGTNEYGTVSTEIIITIKKRNTPPELKIISPANAASALPSPVSLVWSGNDIDSDAVKYTVFTGFDTLSLQVSPVQTDTFLLFQAASGEKIYWKIVASDGKDSTESQLRSFSANYAPSIVIVAPEDETSGLVNTVVLKWNCSDSDAVDKNSLISRIFLDTVNPPKTILADSITSLSFSLPDLLYGKKYFWKVLVSDSKDSTVSKVYSFTIKRRNTPPDLKIISPANGISALTSPVNLVWSGKDIDSNLVKYTVFTGSDSSSLQESSVQTDTSFLFQVASGKKNYWKIVASDGKDSTESQVRSFSTNYAPSVVVTAPEDGASGLVNPVALKWNCNDSDITDKNSLIGRIFLDTVNPPKTLIADSITSISFSPPDLIYGKKYYWKVLVSDSKDSTVSNVYSFQMGLPAKITTQPVDDTLNLPDGSAGFSIGASGNNISYQWLKNGLPVEGANKSYLTIKNGLDRDRYRCIVWDSIATPDTSNEVLLRLAYQVTTTVKGSGSISPSNPFVVNGSNQVFRMTADSGSVISGCSIDGFRIKTADACTLKNIIEARSISTQFYKVPPLLKNITAKNTTFTMGKDGYPTVDFYKHPVTFTYNFYMDSIEVTELDYEYLLNLPPHPLMARSPVQSINWYDAIIYCNARSKKEGLDTVYTYSRVSGVPGDSCTLDNLTINYERVGYRLPTEAEWEFAYRASTKTDFYWDKNLEDYSQANSLNELNLYAAWNGNYSIVAQFPPNKFNLYDMAGNVAEYCNDWFNVNFLITTSIDPVGPSTGLTKVIRGINDGKAESLSAFSCTYATPAKKPKNTGFRCVIASR